MESDVKEERQAIIDSLKTDSAAESKLLISCKQRGGLSTPSSQILKIFTRLELYVREHTQESTEMNVSVRHMLNAALEDAKLRTIFDEVCGETASCEIKCYIFEQLCKFYLVTRIRGFTRQIMERYRQHLRITKRSKSLRKSLEQ